MELSVSLGSPREPRSPQPEQQLGPAGSRPSGAVRCGMGAYSSSRWHCVPLRCGGEDPLVGCAQLEALV